MKSQSAVETDLFTLMDAQQAQAVGVAKIFEAEQPVSLAERHHVVGNYILLTQLVANAYPEPQDVFTDKLSQGLINAGCTASQTTTVSSWLTDRTIRKVNALSYIPDDAPEIKVTRRDGPIAIRVLDERELCLQAMRFAKR